MGFNNHIQKYTPPYYLDVDNTFEFCLNFFFNSVTIRFFLTFLIVVLGGVINGSIPMVLESYCSIQFYLPFLKIAKSETSRRRRKKVVVPFLPRNLYLQSPFRLSEFRLCCNSSCHNFFCLILLQLEFFVFFLIKVVFLLVPFQSNGSGILLFHG